jgi:antibiotic biosynthesis monooxygenase (ABM) superfamily enzyme
MAPRNEDTPTIEEIAELTRRLRELSNAGRDAASAERAAFLTDKDALITRIEASTRRAGTAAWTGELPDAERPALDDGEEWSP